MNNLKQSSLNWAVEHLINEGDTDLFPRPFEINIIKDNWKSLCPDLEKIDIKDYNWNNFRNLLIPKDEFSFRNVSQLDPIDSLLFGAIMIEIGEDIEKKRVPISENKVFSYRFKPTEKGHFYGNISYWEDFWKISKQKAENYSFVVVTDITDFYNQVSHHMVEQQLSFCGIGKFYIDGLLNILKNLNVRISKGIPVGPHPAHMLAELSLIPIDDLLILKGYDFCRFVDDIHIFCNTREEGQIAIYELANAINKLQKLSLNRQKTTIMTKDEFLSKAEGMIVDNPINKEEEIIISIIKSRVDDPYVKINLADLSQDDIIKMSKERIEGILECYINSKYPNYIRLRWFLRRLSQVGVPGGVEYIINNIDKFIPVIGDAANYLKSAHENYHADWKDIGAKLLEALQIPLIQKSEYLQAVILSLFSRIKDLDNIDKLIQNYEKYGPIAQRKIILAATEANASSWLRNFKENYSNLDPWQKRAVIYSSRTFPKDERHFWLKYIRTSNLLEKIIIKSLD